MTTEQKPTAKAARPFRFIYLWILVAALLSSCLTIALFTFFFNMPISIAFLATNTPTITQTFTPTITYTPSLTPSNTPTFTITLTPTSTLTFTPSLTPSLTLTPSATYTPTNTSTITLTPTRTPSNTPTPTPDYTLEAVNQDTIIYLGPTATSQSLFTVPKDAILYVTSTVRGCWVFVTYQPSSGGGSISGWITVDTIGEACEQ